MNIGFSYMPYILNNLQKPSVGSICLNLHRLWNIQITSIPKMDKLTNIGKT